MRGAGTGGGIKSGAWQRVPPRILTDVGQFGIIRWRCRFKGWRYAIPTGGGVISAGYCLLNTVGEVVLTHGAKEDYPIFPILRIERRNAVFGLSEHILN